jgi:hypothetical protein
MNKLDGTIAMVVGIDYYLVRNYLVFVHMPLLRMAACPTIIDNDVTGDDNSVMIIILFSIASST